MVVEAKAPSESVETGLDEARLYANELNALYPTSINPCFRVISCNGLELLSSPVDSARPDIRLSNAELVATYPVFARLVDLCKRDALQQRADDLRRRLRKGTYQRPLSEIGGESFQDEELPQNTFGATIAGDYRRIFNPKSRADRAFIVRNAYVASLSRQRYVEPIDRLIRTAVPPMLNEMPAVEDTSRTKEIAGILRDRMESLPDVKPSDIRFRDNIGDR